MASVKQLADTFGVNKVTVFRKLDELDLRETHTTNDGPRGALDVDAYACSALADAFGKSESEAPSAETEKDTRRGIDETASALTSVVEVLREQLRAADERERRADEAHRVAMAEKDRQIGALQQQLRDANDRLDAIRSRSWIDRLLGRGLPAPRN